MSWSSTPRLLPLTQVSDPVANELRSQLTLDSPRLHPNFTTCSRPLHHHSDPPGIDRFSFLPSTLYPTVPSLQPVHSSPKRNRPSDDAFRPPSPERQPRDRSVTLGCPTTPKRPAPPHAAIDPLLSSPKQW